MITPSFHFKILNDFHDVFTSGSAKFIEKLKENADGKTFDVQKLVHLCTLDIICGKHFFKVHLNYEILISFNLI